MVVSIRASQRLEAIPTYEPGLTTAEVLARYGLSAAIKLASNESPYPPLDAVQAVVRGGVESLNRYPDAYGRVLRAQLAERHHVEIDQVVLGNGSCELILLAGQALLDPATTVVHADPSFAIYPHLAAASGAEAIAVPLEDDGGHDLMTMAAHVDERTRLVIVCNPNNPTGVYRGADELERFVEMIPDDVAIVIDEAYHDFVDLAESGRMISLARRRSNVLVTRTFSKAFGLPGLRVGYGVGGQGWIQALEKVRQPFNTNALAQAAALAALGERSAMAERVASIVSERDRVQAALQERRVPFLPSRANFILVGAPSWDHGVHESLLRLGIIVRDGAPLGVPGRVRVTIGTPQENDAFLAALDQVTQSQATAIRSEGSART